MITESLPVSHARTLAQEQLGILCSSTRWLLAWGGAERCSVYSLVCRGAHCLSTNTSKASDKQSPRIGLSHPWNRSARISVNCVLFPLSDCGLLEGRDSGVMTVCLPKPRTWEQMLRQSLHSGRLQLNPLPPPTPPPFPSCLRALSVVCTEAHGKG